MVDTSPSTPSTPACSGMTIAYLAVAMSGALIGLLLGLAIGWELWT